jgi:GDP-mannose pyrophosphatase NudK
LSGPQLILIAGPYRSGTNDVPARIAANLRFMNEVALQVYERGHVPVTGEALALPLAEVAGSRQIGDEVFNRYFHPSAVRLLARCDACLRVGGPSAGADEMVRQARALGKRTYSSVDEIPLTAPAPSS